MYGTIEHRIACHQEAQARRTAGLPVWDNRLNIKHLLSQEDPASANDLSKPAEGIFKALEALRAKIDPDRRDWDLEVLLDRFEELAFSPQLGEIDIALGLEAFNDALGDLYDWADTRRVWVE